MRTITRFSKSLALALAVHASGIALAQDLPSPATASPGLVGTLSREHWTQRQETADRLLAWQSTQQMTAAIAMAAEPPAGQPESAAVEPLAAALSSATWQQVENSIDRALAWLAAQQLPDGSFPSIPAAQPSATSLPVLAFLSRGHHPEFGPYGPTLSRAVDFVLSCQTTDGLFSNQPLGPNHVDKSATHTAVYNHAIAALMLAEVYGHTGDRRAEAIKQAIVRALTFTRELQTRPKANDVDRGGWRYIRLRFGTAAADSDLSVTGWQLMFLRSAKNAEFNVPQEHIDEAVDFVRRCWDETTGVFNYALVGAGDVRSSRGMMGVGILSLSLSGHHQSPMAIAAGDWLARRPFRSYGETFGANDRFFYSAYYCSQAMAQLGGRHWKSFFPPLVAALLAGQSPDGSWPPEPTKGDAVFGNALTTAMAVLALSPPLQLLPIYQR